MGSKNELGGLDPAAVRREIEILEGLVKQRYEDYVLGTDNDDGCRLPDFLNAQGTTTLDGNWQRMITGSRFAAVCGVKDLSYTDSPWKAARRMAGLEGRVESNEYMEFGKERERAMTKDIHRVVGAALSRRGLNVPLAPAMPSRLYKSDRFLFLAATPDFEMEALQSKVLVELKSPSKRPFTGQIKVEYYLQMQLQMAMTNTRLCYFLESRAFNPYTNDDCRFCRSHPDVIEHHLTLVEFDEEIYQLALLQALRFYFHIFLPLVNSTCKQTLSESSLYQEEARKYANARSNEYNQTRKQLYALCEAKCHPNWSFVRQHADAFTPGDSASSLPPVPNLAAFPLVE